MQDLPLVGNGKRREITKETVAAMLKVVGFVVDAEPVDLVEVTQTRENRAYCSEPQVR